MKIASNSKCISKYKDEYELSKHEIFTIFPLNPDGIVRIGNLIKDSQETLDNIVIAEKDKKNKLDEQKNKPVEIAKVASEIHPVS